MIDDSDDSEADAALADDTDAESDASSPLALLDPLDAALDAPLLEADANEEGKAWATRGNPHPPERGVPFGKTAGSAGMGRLTCLRQSQMYLVPL